MRYAMSEKATKGLHRHPGSHMLPDASASTCSEDDHHPRWQMLYRREIPAREGRTGADLATWSFG